MRQCHFTWARYTMVLLMVSAGHSLADGLRPEEIVEEKKIEEILIGRGYENLAVQISGQTLKVWCENRIMRYQVLGTWAVLTELSESVPPDWSLELTMLRYGHPVVRLAVLAGDVKAWAEGSISSQALSDRTEINLAFDSKPPGRLRQPSYLKSDLIVGPDRVVSQLGLPNVWIRANFDLSAEWRMTPFSGTILTGRLLFPLWQYHGTIEKRNREIRPGTATATWMYAPTATSMMALSFGFYEQANELLDAYGFVADFRMFSADGIWAVGATVARTGRLSYTVVDTINFDRQGLWAFTKNLYNQPFELKLARRFESIDFSVIARWGRFHLGDHGWRVDLVRSYGEVELGIFGLKSDGMVRAPRRPDDTRLLGGIRVVLPVWPSKLKNPSTLRVVTMPSFRWAYRYRTSFAGYSLVTRNSLSDILVGYMPTELRSNLDRIRRRITRQTKLTGPRNPKNETFAVGVHQ